MLNFVTTIFVETSGVAKTEPGSEDFLGSDTFPNPRTVKTEAESEDETEHGAGETLPHLRTQKELRIILHRCDAETGELTNL